MSKLGANCIEINGKIIGEDFPTYFIADIAANHDGSFDRAVKLIKMAADSGANAAKFQHFKATTIVSGTGFSRLGGKLAHQSSWDKSVEDVYRTAELPLEWTADLLAVCKESNIDFFTSAYDLSLVDSVDPFVPAFKIGSGDITWLEIIRHIATKQKPGLLATGASSLEEVKIAADTFLAINSKLALLQCNTNYSGEEDNLDFVNLNVINTFRKLYPDLVIGLSDHTHGYAAVLGAVALGARIIEKHFTDDPDRTGPDHKFSMTPKTWTQMVNCVRELERALGKQDKEIEKNEIESAVVQRRALYASKHLNRGDAISRSDIAVLRPCPSDAISAEKLDFIVGKFLSDDVEKGGLISWNKLE